jgi:hypothetical protein
MSKVPQILVTGDYSPDYDVYLPNVTQLPGETASSFRVSAGGAGIIFQLLKQVASGGEAKEEPPFEIGFSHSYSDNGMASAPTLALWLPSELHRLSANETSRSTKIWRLQHSIRLADVNGLPFVPANPPKETPLTSPDILVIEDDAADFRFKRRDARQSPASTAVKELCCWPNSVETVPESVRWILLKTSAPILRGDLWRHLLKSQAERLLVIVSVNDLREERVRISRGISWERTAEDLAREVLGNPESSGLRAVRHLIVNFDSEGALWMERTGEETFRWRLIFDPDHLEREWAERLVVKGGAYGYLATFAASVAANLASQPPEDADSAIQIGITQGLMAMRFLRGYGHGPVTSASPGLPLTDLASVILGREGNDGTNRTPEFAFKELGSFGVAEIPSEALARSQYRWRILEHTDCIDVNPAGQPLYGAAHRLALRGLRAIGHVPHARFGELLSIDRDEIEALRNLKRLIQDYLSDEGDKKPLSLGVFGPPGAGKSFGIKQISAELTGGKPAFLEFNLSQFSDERDLIGALHQVRDKRLEGNVPVVFWDEFDSKNYKWLQFLLAPMQDGKFQEGQVTHPIGRCIFVFAGATSYDFKNFGPSPENANEFKEFKLLKGPDFVSRLHGTFDVLGPNRRQVFHPDGKGGGKWQFDRTDVCFPVRRALLLRAKLGLDGKRENDRMDMDLGLMRALLETYAYKYGARSLEKIALSLKRDAAGGINRSSLPPDEVLSMSLEDLDEFKAIMGRVRQFQAYAPKLAPAVHLAWLDVADRENPNKADFEKLSDEVKADNLAAALRIPLLLELAGLYLLPGDETAEAVSDRIVKRLLETHLELLAEEEHILWMQQKIQNGWRFAETRDNARKLHNCLASYAKISTNDKERDRNSVRKFPEMIRLAGFKIVASRPIIQPEASEVDSVALQRPSCPRRASRRYSGR